jgi:hypothetical protein
MWFAPKHSAAGSHGPDRALTGVAFMWQFGRDPFDAFQFFALQLPCMIFGSLLGTLGVVAILQVLGV